MPAESGTIIFAHRHATQNPMPFEGNGDGLQHAIDYLSTGGADPAGGTIILGPGDFTISRTLLFSTGKIIVRGSGIRTTRLLYTGSGDFIQIGVNDGVHSGGDPESYDGTASQIVIQDMYIAKSGAAGTSRGIVDWESGSNIYERLTIAGFGTGYFGIGADVVTFRDVNFSGNTVGCHLASRSDQNQFHNCYFPQNGIGLLLEYAEHPRLFGGQFVFSTTADIVMDCPAAATEGGDIRDGIGNLEIFGTWFESAAGVNIDRHIWIGRNGTSARSAIGLFLFGCYFQCSNTDNLIEVDAGSEIHLFANSQAGTVQTGQILVNLVASLVPIIHVDDNRFASDSVKPLFTGAGYNNVSMEQHGRGSRMLRATAYAANVAIPASNNAPEYNEITALTGNITIDAPTGNPPRGKELVFRFLQDGVGGRTVTWNAIFKHAWSDAGNVANAQSNIRFRFNGTNWIQLGAQTPYFV